MGPRDARVRAECPVPKDLSISPPRPLGRAPLQEDLLPMSQHPQCRSITEVLPPEATCQSRVPGSPRLAGIRARSLAERAISAGLARRAARRRRAPAQGARRAGAQRPRSPHSGDSAEARAATGRVLSRQSSRHMSPFASQVRLHVARSVSDILPWSQGGRTQTARSRRRDHRPGAARCGRGGRAASRPRVSASRPSAPGDRRRRRRRHRGVPDHPGGGADHRGACVRPGARRRPPASAVSPRAVERIPCMITSLVEASLDLRRAATPAPSQQGPFAQQSSKKMQSTSQ